MSTPSAPSTGSGDGNLGLNLNDNDSIVDPVGNKLAGTGTGTVSGGGTGNGSFTGQVYVIDKTGPANAPTITAGPAQNSLVASTSAASPSRAARPAWRATSASSTRERSRPAAARSRTRALAQGGHDFSVRAVDAAGNPGPASALRHWTVDTVAPPKPVLTLTPPDPSSTATSKFAWTDSEAGVTFQCSIENGPWTACTTPFTFEAAVNTSNNGQHQFAVRAVDAAGNTSEPATYKWKVDKGSGQDYTISGTVSSLLYPTDAARPINIAFNNPNAGNGGSGVNGIQVWNLTVTIVSIAGPHITPRALRHRRFRHHPVQGRLPLLHPAGHEHASLLRARDPRRATWPSIRLVNRPTVNQDGCKNVTVHLSYTGTP